MSNFRWLKTENHDICPVSGDELLVRDGNVAPCQGSFIDDSCRMVRFDCEHRGLSIFKKNGQCSVKCNYIESGGK